MLTSSLLTALAGERPTHTPIWFMRQAGRSLPEYRETRAGLGMIESCLIPDVAAEITLQPVRRHNVDAAIFFSDIMVPLVLAGLDIEIAPGVGPVVAQPLRTASDVAAVIDRGLDDVSAITEAIALIRKELADDKALIGFAGAPFTLAAYLVEGRPSRDHLAARGMMLADPTAWHLLAGWCAKISGAFLAAQIDAGAQAVQLFDSWAGSLSRQDYAAFVAPHSQATLDVVAGRVPQIHFAAGGEHLMEEFAKLGTAALGCDYRTPLDQAAARCPEKVLQGNLDPAVLTAPWTVIEAAVINVLERGKKAPSHIFNLGHGVPPSTDPEVLTAIVELVHRHG
ncbi:MAG: uroporphyrinogen decarboxylase [Propionibacteriaceae bacterium]